MPKCTATELEFGRLGRRRIEANFEGGALSSDGGLMLLRQVDRCIGLSGAVAKALHDPRHPDLITHELRVLFSALAYTLMQRLREIGLSGTELASATAATIRVHLLKIGAAVIRNTRPIRILFASHHPQRETFLAATRALASP